MALMSRLSKAGAHSGEQALVLFTPDGSRRCFWIADDAAVIGQILSHLLTVS